MQLGSGNVNNWYRKLFSFWAKKTIKPRKVVFFDWKIPLREMIVPICFAIETTVVFWLLVDDAEFSKGHL